MPEDALLEPSKHKFDCPKCSKQGYVSQSCYLNEPPNSDNNKFENQQSKEANAESAPDSTIQTIKAPLATSTINPCQAISPDNKQNYLTIVRNSQFTVNITQ